MMQRLTLGAAILGAAFLLGPATAQDQGTTALACTNAGNQYRVGEFACIAACHERRRLARCDVVLEKASWTYVAESCPTAMINPPWPSLWSEVPALSAMSPIPLTVNLTAIPPDERLAFAAFGEATALMQ